MLSYDKIKLILESKGILTFWPWYHINSRRNIYEGRCEKKWKVYQNEVNKEDMN